MPPSLSRGTPWTSKISPLILPLLLGILHSAVPCPSPCLCASDIISCSNQNLSSPPFKLPGYSSRLDLSHNIIKVLTTSWTSQTLHRLTTLTLNWNFISEIQDNAFAPTPHLTHLDLSSNQLAVLNAAMFTSLKELQELLLFGNQISTIEKDTFRSLLYLQRLYLSRNLLTQFPIELYEQQNGPKNLTFLDLSANHLSHLPVQKLLSLHDKSEIYLQDNPLVCDCPVRALMEYWTWKQYRPIIDFGSGCKDGGEFECSLQENPTVQDGEDVYEYQVDPGRELSVPCPGISTAQEGALVYWVTPHKVLNSSEYNSSKDPTQRFTVLLNGTLEIHSAQMEDSGTYSCVVSRGHHFGSGESLEVTIMVGNSSLTSSEDKHDRSSEHFNTAFTTLASCVVSIILVLLYLYLTPCRCGRNGWRCGGRAIVVCSDPREVEEGQRRANGKRVAFLEPQLEGCDRNGAPKSPVLTPGYAGTEGILKNGSRTVGQTSTDSTHVE
ncbi:amphoterin-induced protein 1-like [Boleophthalmus pectinirostris]|uniref:amphoterin-induced protein 1-like n=1 Tax=Boleophthalmus pectinirostris TaxID=150288 RepID=UPI00242FA04C|nr:amphoterin-induced protein 1-like [Boleophthalmus pectinirostris]